MGQFDGTIDDGTLARTDSPVPGPIGLDAPGGSGQSSEPNMSRRIVAYAQQKSGTRVGNGECFTLADKALKGAGAKSAADFGTVTRDADYKWGSTVSLTDLQPGDIIQFRGYRYDREVTTHHSNGSTETYEDFQKRPHHTAIVETVDGNGAVTVLEQNAPEGSPVVRSHLFFKSTTIDENNKSTTIKVQGTFWFFRPQAK
jgi:hypothetical protein